MAALIRQQVPAPAASLDRRKSVVRRERDPPLFGGYLTFNPAQR